MHPILCLPLLIPSFPGQQEAASAAVREERLASVDSIFADWDSYDDRIGSRSKQFTATALAMLVLDGEVDLDAPLGIYFPELPDQDPPVRMGHLVRHTSGIPDYIGMQLTRGGGSKAWFSTESTLQMLAEVPLDFTPGSRYEYSNSNDFLMGECGGSAARACGTSRAGTSSTHWGWTSHASRIATTS